MKKSESYSIKVSNTLQLFQSEYNFFKIKQMAFISKKHYWKTILLNKTIINKVIEETWKKVKSKSKEETLILITGLLQKGGSNKNAMRRQEFYGGWKITLRINSYN